MGGVCSTIGQDSRALTEGVAETQLRPPKKPMWTCVRRGLGVEGGGLRSPAISMPCAHAAGTSFRSQISPRVPLVPIPPRFNPPLRIPPRYDDDQLHEGGDGPSPMVHIPRWRARVRLVVSGRGMDGRRWPPKSMTPPLTPSLTLTLTLTLTLSLSPALTSTSTTYLGPNYFACDVHSKALRRIAIRGGDPTGPADGNGPGGAEQLDPPSELSAELLATFRHCELRSLCLSRCRGVTDAWLESLSATSVRHLETLDLSRCKLLTDEGLLQLHSLKNLQRVSFRDCPLLGNASTLCLASSDQILTLDLTNCRRLGDDGVRNLRHLTKLTTLSLAGCDDLTDKSLEHVASLSSLAILSLERLRLITDRGVGYLDRLLCLEELKLGWCIGLTDHALQLIANFDSPATNLHLGVHLGFYSGNNNNNDDNNGKDEQHAHSHVKSAPVDIPNGHLNGPLNEISDGPFDPGTKANSTRSGRGDYSASAHTCAPTRAPTCAGMGLKRLSLNRCRISDDGLATLANLSSLESLNLGGCEDVTDDGLASLAKLPSLTNVDLSGILNITRAHALFPGCEHLNLDNTMTDDHTIIAIVDAILNAPPPSLTDSTDPSTDLSTDAASSFGDGGYGGYGAYGAYGGYGDEWNLNGGGGG
eukprot:CAMPEP_0119479600 /NCGR_PEP_ID=MMETSP1344-20130328/8793_1 /TAXON_ID=236787 /ORGANISM="Florenciella parvula, Strain CCMP2471" /LENGTH=643 /DNA_ID=CAMNT_0007513843 /DNA_START=104 /DNA_END=2033 /DNA_ORIENTATION=+